MTTSETTAQLTSPSPKRADARRNEETLLSVGEDDLVRNFRLRFQEAMTEPMIKSIEELTGRKVIGYHSQIVFHPDHTFEIFVLDEPPEDRA